jgi:hypothetical protein
MRYLMISFFRQPGGEINEEARISKRIKPADITSCNIIVDYATKKVEKCTVEGNKLDTDFDKINEYYKKVYPAMIATLEKEAPITGKIQSQL